MDADAWEIRIQCVMDNSCHAARTCVFNTTAVFRFDHATKKNQYYVVIG